MSMGGAASGADVRAGGAYVEIYGKDKLTKQIDSIKASAKSQVMGLSKLVGGFALADVAIAAGTATMGLNKFNAVMEEGVRVTERLEAAQAKLREKVFEKVGGKIGMPVDVVPEGADRLAFLDRELANAEKNLSAVGKEADKTNAELSELRDSLENWFVGKLPFAGHAQEVEERQLEARANEFNARRKALQDHVQQLREQLAAQKQQPAVIEATFIKGIQTQINELNNLAATFGMTAKEAALFKVKMEAAMKGIEPSRGMLGQIGQAHDELDFKQRRRAVQEAADAMKDSLMGGDKMLRDLQKERDALAKEPLILETPAQELDRRKKLEQVEKEIATRRRQFAVQEDMRKRQAEDPLAKALEKIGVSSITRGGFGGETSLGMGIGSHWQRVQAEQTKEIVKNGAKAVTELVEIKNGVNAMTNTWKIR